MYLTIAVNIVEFNLNSASIYWNLVVFGRSICCFFFFLNNTSEIYKELLVRCLETIQHICMSILILNKTITFAWLTKIMQILGARSKLLGLGNNTTPKTLGFDNHARPKRPCQTQASWVWQPSHTQVPWVWNNTRPKRFWSRNHARPKLPCQT
jgi:hypothetical protein